MAIEPRAAAAADTNPFWDYAVDLYGRPGVAAACLNLQDRHGVDVNLLLFAVWAGAAQGVQLDGDQLNAAEQAVAAWRDEVIRPLRAVRRRVRWDGAAAAPLREVIGTAELMAERIAQDRLIRAVPLPQGRGDRSRAADNVVRLLDRCGARGGDAERAILAAVAQCPEPPPAGESKPLAGDATRNGRPT